MANNRDKFLKLAEKRVNKAIAGLRLVGNLSNKANYSYEPSEADKILRALESEIREVKMKFKSGQSSSDGDFKL